MFVPCIFFQLQYLAFSLDTVLVQLNPLASAESYDTLQGRTNVLTHPIGNAYKMVARVNTAHKGKPRDFGDRIW